MGIIPPSEKCRPVKEFFCEDFDLVFIHNLDIQS